MQDKFPLLQQFDSEEQVLAKRSQFKVLRDNNILKLDHYSSDITLLRKIKNDEEQTKASNNLLNETISKSSSVTTPVMESSSVTTPVGDGHKGVSLLAPIKRKAPRSNTMENMNIIVESVVDKTNPSAPESNKADTDTFNTISKSWQPPIRFSGALHFRQALSLAELEQYTNLRKGSPNAPISGETTPLSEVQSQFKHYTDEIYACSQPAGYGMRAILNYLTFAKQDQHVLWINLREEPLVYINSRPYALRERDHPFHNLNYYTGIDRTRVEQMEDRLKLDVLEEAKQYRGNIMVHDEVSNLVKEDIERAKQQASTDQLVASWEALGFGNTNVFTTHEVFEELQKEGYNVTYCRVPLTAEAVPDFNDYDEILASLKDATPESKIVFNDQLGKRRCTHAMVIALIYNIFTHKKTDFILNLLSKKKTKEANKESTDIQSQFHRGEYKAILDLLRILPHGEDAKALADVCIDQCGMITHLRESIYSYKLLAERARSDEDRDMLYQTAFKHLSRYFQLIVFCEYMYSKQSEELVTFSQWIKQHPVILSMLNNQKQNIAEALSGRNIRSDLSDVEYVYNRKGKVLSSGSILKADHFFQRIPQFTLDIPGAPNFRQVDLEFKIFGTANPTVAGFENILQHLNAKQRKVIFVNLREEPVLYINGNSYVLRDLNHPFQNISLRNISVKNLEEIEERIKQDIIKELSAEKGRLLLHDETEDSTLTTFWETVSQSTNVLTTADISQMLINKGYQLEYHRVPVTPLKAFTISDYENLQQCISSNNDGTEQVVLSDHFGLGRSSFSMIIAGIIYKMKLEREVQFTPVSTNAHFEILSSLLRLLPDGVERKQDVDYIIDTCTNAVSSLDPRKETEKNLLRSEKARTQIEIDTFMKKAITSLKNYLSLVIFASYFYRYGHTDVTYGQFVQSRTEFFKIFQEIDEDPKHSLHITRYMETEDPHLTKNKGLQLLYTRNGKVLQKKTILKKDHFPGCQRKHLTPKIEGSPNFRQIDSLPVYGCAMCTRDGIENVLHYLNAKQVACVWTNLREEPVVYINGNPYVLRDYEKPIRNIEHSGISSQRVEKMEIRLKEDVLAEAQQHNGYILLHDDNPNDLKLESQWEKLVSVQTPREVYDNFIAKGYLLQYFRIPVTDERAPDSEDFDAIVGHIWKCEQDTIKIWNCQMGRGRTTTGIVVCVLINEWKAKMENAASSKSASPLSPSKPTRLSIALQTNPITGLASSGSSSSNLAEENKVNHLRNGNYKIITALIRVLEHGVENKTQVDSVLDICAAMQNLRTAIFDFRQQALQTDLPEKTRKFALETGKKYLERYFLLIVFNEYLHDQLDKFCVVKENLSLEEYIETKKVSFKDWLEARQEITNILKSSPLQLE